MDSVGVLVCQTIYLFVILLLKTQARDPAGIYISFCLEWVKNIYLGQIFEAGAHQGWLVFLSHFHLFLNGAQKFGRELVNVDDVAEDDVKVLERESS